MTDAIREDVSPEEEQGGQPNERLNALEEIAARNADKEDREPPEEEETEVEEDETPEAADAPEEEIEINVLGETKKVPLSKVLDMGKRTLQKEVAADTRLEQLTAKERELAEKERLIQQLWATQQPAARPPQVNPQDAFLAQQEKWLEAIQYGDKDTGLRAMQEWQAATIAAAQQSTLPLIEQQRAELEQERLNEAIFGKFNAPPEQGGFADITTDPDLLTTAKQLVDYKLRVEGKPNRWETYAEVGEMIRTMRGPAKPAPLDIEARKAKKRAVESVPAMGGRVSAPQEKEPTREDVLAEMRKARAG